MDIYAAIFSTSGRSIFGTKGGQYANEVSEKCEEFQKVNEFVVGWLCLLDCIPIAEIVESVS